MTAARLSPAASLLRNSKLFALPPAIALPVPEPSSEPVPRSDTATTVYPTRAAIETSLTSLGRGDWGFKRPLPLKSTTKTGSPTVRLNKGIDTREHIADFDSAADHVLTLKKFQELNQSIQHPRHDKDSKIHLGAFRKGYDNTTNLSESAPGRSKYSGVWPSLSPAELQKQMPSELQSDIQEPENNAQQFLQRTGSDSTPRRWRYEGPSLVQMSGYEFDEYLKTFGSSKQKEFREIIKNRILAKKRTDHTVKARDEGTVGEVDISTLQVSDDEVNLELRRLRQNPDEFGTLIARFLDLPEGPTAEGLAIKSMKSWEYGRNTLASRSYGEHGPPRSHPSAGLSYIHFDRWAQNHASFGPQQTRLPVVARNVKTRTRGNTNVTNMGVAGFIVAKNSYKGTRENPTPAFEPRVGGMKSPVDLMSAEIDEDSRLKLSVQVAKDYQVENERAVHFSMTKDKGVPALRARATAGSRVMQPLTRNHGGRVEYKKMSEASTDDQSDDFDTVMDMSR